MSSRAKRRAAVWAVGVIALAVALIVPRLGGDSHPRSRAAGSSGGCTLPHAWYPAPLPGSALQQMTGDARARLLDGIGLTGEQGDARLDVRAGKPIAALFAITSHSARILGQLDAVRATGAAASQPLPGVRRVQTSSGAVEYGRKGCAVMLIVGPRAADVDALGRALFSR